MNNIWLQTRKLSEDLAGPIPVKKYASIGLSEAPQELMVAEQILLTNDRGAPQKRSWYSHFSCTRVF